MTMSTQILADAARLLATQLVDQVQVYNVGPKVTTGISVSRPLVAVGSPVAGLVQATTLENASESQTTQVFSVKVARETPLAAGQAVKVLRCHEDSSLEGQVLLLDKVIKNGWKMLTKGIASTASIVNQEGKEGLAA